MYNVGYNADWNGTFFKFTVIMAFSNCTINPFIYLTQYRDYQAALNICFSCQKLNKEMKTEKSSNSSSGIIISGQI